MDTLTRLSALFRYPDEGYAARAQALAAAIGSAAVGSFATRIAGLTTTALQERYIDTFDLNPSATLEIGWHLFGEQYERGMFLVTLREGLRAAGIAETGELPDHLLHVLPLLDAMPPTDRDTFVERHLIPALDKIGAVVPAENPFADLLGAIRELTAPAAAAGGCHD